MQYRGGGGSNAPPSGAGGSNVGSNRPGQKHSS